MSLQELDQLHKEIADLKDQLEYSDLIGNTIEERTIYYLNRLTAADKKTLDREFVDLKQFWLSSIDWCSELSKQIEKLVIMHEDLRDG
ncbi:MAG: hypothetical protein QNL14_19835 [Deltaproteobacteria bacterium]|jgi:hypothetical protein|nr:hypothetical protein [Deltaproteobacteria bacterium]